MGGVIWTTRKGAGSMTASSSGCFSIIGPSRWTPWVATRLTPATIPPVLCVRFVGRADQATHHRTGDIGHGGVPMYRGRWPRRAPPIVGSGGPCEDTVDAGGGCRDQG